MASKSGNDQADLEDVEELLDVVDSTLERVRTMYEQYFLGIQKQAPAHLHTEIERRLRDLTQMNVRNTGLRYRLATLQQKFGSYNSYWRRTLRQIEQGTYFRNLSKVGREAIRTGADIPEEILAAMPKRMREQVLRDREQALAIARRRDGVEAAPADLQPPDGEELIAMIKEPTELRRNLNRTPTGALVVDESDGDIDIDAFFAAVQQQDEPKRAGPPAPVQTRTRPRVTGSTPAVTTVTTPSTPLVMPGSTPATRQTGPVPAMRQTGPVPVVPAAARPPVTPVMPPPTPGSTRQSGSMPAMTAAPPLPSPRQTGAMPAVPLPRPGAPLRAQTSPGIPPPARATAPVAAPAKIADPAAPAVIAKAPSQAVRPNPIAPGAAAARGAVPVESMAGPFPRAQTPATGTPVVPVAPRPPASVKTQPYPSAKPPQAPPLRPPPGMSDADVNALYAKYVKAKEMVGEKVGPGEHGKLLKTINAQAPKIMEQYNAKAVDFSVVVKDNQVIIRAKPKT